METTCQPSYPLNSENASPPGTFRVYLSWADMALAPSGADECRHDNNRPHAFALHYQVLLCQDWQP